MCVYIRATLPYVLQSTNTDTPAAEQDTCYLAAYLDAGHALRIDPSFEKEVCLCVLNLLTLRVQKYVLPCCIPRCLARA
jgi:hypothetical protein